MRTVVPDETQAPLIVDPDAVLAFSIAAQCFQPIAGRYTEIRERRCGVQHVELAQSNRPKRLELPYPLAIVEGLCSLTLKAPDHPSHV